MHSHCFTYSLMNSFPAGDRRRPGAEGGAGDIIRDVHSAPADDLDSSDDSLQEQVLTIAADRDVAIGG